MKHFLSLIILILSVLMLSTNGCKIPTKPQPNDSTNYILDEKPNIYIYPDHNIDLTVKIIFPAGGSVTKSDPQYNNGWNVRVSKDGKIDSSYDCLFYESRMPDLTQNEYGWIVKKEELKNFFSTNLAESNFKENEIYDFISYWIPRLKDYNYYAIYPQYTSTMEKMSILDFSIMPAHVFRLNYVIRGLNNKNINIKTPEIQKANRNGYNSVEWGVILK